MLEQIRLIFDINEEVCNAMDHKVNRLNERISATRSNIWEDKTESGLLEE